MEDNNFFGLEAKIQKIITNYQELKSAYEKLKAEKDDLETKQIESMDEIDQKNIELQELKSSCESLRNEVYGLKIERDEVVKKLEDYESKAREAALKLDGLFASLND